MVVWSKDFNTEVKGVYIRMQNCILWGQQRLSKMSPFLDG